MKTKSSTFRKRPAILAASISALIGLAGLSAVQAATFNYSNLGATNDWGDATNWVGGVAPSNGSDLVFNDATPFVFSNNFPLPEAGNTPFLTNVASMTWGAAKGTAVTTAGGALTLGAGGLTNNSAFTQTISFTDGAALGITLGAAQAWTANTASFNVTSNVALNGFVLTVAGASNTTLGGTVSGSGGLIKNGAGNLIITNALTLDGGATLNAGTVTANGGLTISGGTLTGAGTLAGSLNYTSTTGLSLFSGAITGAASTLTVNDELAGDGSGLAVAGANIYGGGTTVTSGYLAVQGAGTLGSANVVVGSSAASTATLALVNGGSVTNTVSINGIGTANFTTPNRGALYVFNNSTGTISGAVTVASNAVVGVDAGSTLNLTGGITNSASVLTFANVGNGAGIVNVGTTGISGGGSVIVNGLTVNLNVASTYTGGTTINSGTANVTATNGASTGAMTINSTDGTTDGQLKVTGAAITQNVSSLTINAPGGTSTAVTGSGTLQVNGALNVVDNTAHPGNGFATTIDVATLNLAAATPTINVTGQNVGPAELVIASVITGTNGVTINAAPSTLNGATAKVQFSSASVNTYTGTTTVNDGGLSLNGGDFVTKIPGDVVIGDNTGAANSAFVRLQNGVGQIALTSNMTIKADGLFDMNTFGDTINNLTINSGNVTGVPTNGSNSLALTGALNMTGGSINGGTGATPGLFLLGGAGASNVTATSDAAGNTATINSNVSLGGLTRTFTVNDGPAAVDLSITGNILTAGGIIKAGAGTMNVSGTNAYTGPTTINAGTLHSFNASGLGGAASGLVTLNATATLATTNALNVGSFLWNGGKIQLAPGVTPDIVNVTGAFTNGGAGGAYALDATGLMPGSTYTLTTFGTTNFTQPQFAATFLNTTNVTPQGQFLLNANNVQFAFTGATATGPLIQNSAPISTPTFADFIVSGPVQTGGPNENNQIKTLTFTPGSSLTIHNTLFVTQGPVILVGGSTLTLDGALSASQLQMLFGSLLNGNGSILGDLINAGLVSPGHSPGQIHVTGNYTQTPTGTLRIEIGGRDLSQHDLLSVGGTAKLDGTLQLLRLDNFKLKRDQSVTFLTANGGVSGQFATVENGFASDTILEPTVVYHANSVALEAVQGSFKKFADRDGLTFNQKSVARALDSVAFRHSPPKVIDYLDSRKLTSLPGDFDKIAPEELTSMFTIGVSLANAQAQNIQRRTDDIRSGTSGFSAAGLALNGDNPSYSGSFGLATGVAGPNGNDDGKEVKETKQVIPEENRWGTFLSGTGEWVSVANTDNARGYNLESGGFTLGIDYKVMQNFAIGLMAGYTGTSADLVDRGRVYVNGGKIGLYATFFQNEQAAQAPTMSKDSSKEAPNPAPTPAPSIARGFYADLAVTGGYNSYDTRRSALQGEARGDTDGGELNALFGAGYDFKKGGLTFGPTASFNYTYLGTNDFTEHGSLAPLNIHGGKGESLRTAFGLKASYDWKVGGILIKPEIRAAWQHEYGDSAYELGSNFANGGGNNFTVNGPELGRDSVLLGAGFAIQCSERFSTYFYYDGELGRKNYESNSVTGGVRVAF